jgi:hypothetical protein
MSKQYTNLTKSFPQHVADFNVLVNKVGNLSMLTTSQDSDLVGAINAVLTEGGVDSAAIISILDSGQYVAFGDLTASTDSDLVIVFGNQTINGIKIFGSKTVARDGILLDTGNVGTAPTAAIRNRSRLAASQNFKINHDSSGTQFQWSAGDNSNNVNVVEILNSTADSALAGSVRFSLGAGITTATIDSAGILSASTLLTRTKADSRYILDSATVGENNYIAGSVGTAAMADSSVSQAKMQNRAVNTINLALLAVTSETIATDAVDRTKLANEVSLIIYDSNGTAVKTLYGAGS